MTKRTLWMYTWAVLAIALFTFGCGGDDGVDQSVHDMALAAAADAQAEADAAAAALAAAEAQAEADAAAAAAAAAAAEAQAEADAAAAAAALAAEEEEAAEAAAAAAAALAAAEAAAAADAAAAAAATAAELMAVQTAANDAAMAAKTASYAAAADAMAAMTATANIATLQTSATSKSKADDAQDAADAAMAAYMTAMAASDAAAAAMTVEEATEAKVMAEAAQANAETHATTAMESSNGAVMAAMSELMIDGTVKSVGDSMIDAGSGSPNVGRATMGTEGQHFIQDEDTAADDTRYKQAVASGTINIGKSLDASGARLMIIDGYQGQRDVWVFVEGNGEAADATLGGMLGTVVGDLAGFPLADTNADTDGLQSSVTMKSIGTYYLANDRATLPAADDVVGDPASDAGAGAGGDNALNAYDQVDLTKGGKEYEIFELSDGTNTHHARIVETITDDQNETTYHYQPVDIMANASMSDGGDVGGDADDLVPVTATIPAATKYQHLHFGIWAGTEVLNEGEATMLADLGIGFVQSIGDGMTQKQGIGSATFYGDWVAAVQRAHAQGEGEIDSFMGKATLTANFGTDEFEGELDGLVTLEGSLSGNGFEGTMATVDADNLYGLTVGAEFTGEFEGGIYGSDGEEAGGIFDFTSDNDGAFRGAFGGHRDGKP